MHQSLIPPRSSRKRGAGAAPCACWLSKISLRRHPGRTPALGKFAFSLGEGPRFLLSPRNDDQLRKPSIPPARHKTGVKRRRGVAAATGLSELGTVFEPWPT